MNLNFLELYKKENKKAILLYFSWSPYDFEFNAQSI